MSRFTRRSVAAMALGTALAAAHPSHAVVVVLDGSTGAAYDAVGDGWFFAGAPTIPPDGVGDAGGNMLAVVSQAGVVEMRAMAEFPLAPLTGIDPNDVVSATITYTIDDVLSTFGPSTLFDGTASDPIDVYVYSADGSVDTTDFAPVGATLLDSVATGLITDTSLATSGAIAFEVDATQVVKDFLTNTATHLGVMLDTSDTPTGTSLDDLAPPGVAGGQLPFVTVVVVDPTSTTSTTTVTTTITSTSITISSSTTSTTIAPSTTSTTTVAPSTTSTSVPPSTTSTTTTPSTTSTSTTVPSFTDHPQDVVKMILTASKKGKEKLVWVSKSPAVTLPATDPTVVGATLKITNPTSLETATIDLPAANWAPNKAGTVYKFKNKQAPSGPSVVKVSMLKSTTLEVAGKGTGITLDEVTQGTIQMVLTVGSDRYCSTCSAPNKDEGAAGPVGQYVAKGCAAPPICP